MKKFRMVTVIAFGLGLALLSGCGETKDEMEKFRDAYARTKDAVTVTQSIEVVRGKLAVYLYEKEYEKTGSGYAMTYTEQRLNKVDAQTEEAYTVTTGADTVASAETFNPSLELYLDDFRHGYEIRTSSFRGELQEGKEDEVFGFTEEHAEMENVVLSLALRGTAVREVTVDFDSGIYSVSIVLTFTYAV